MNSLDIIFIIIVSIGFAFGYYKGIVKQLTLGAGIVIGLLQAILFYPTLSSELCRWTDWDPLICTPLAFILIFSIIIGIFELIGRMIRWFFRLILLGFADRVLGGLLCSIIVTLLFTAIVSLVNNIDEKNKLFGKTSQESSVLYKPMKRLSIVFLEEIKKEINEKEE